MSKMNEVPLLKSYIETLEKENQAKNQERESLYQHLTCLQNQNSELSEQLSLMGQQLYKFSNIGNPQQFQIHITNLEQQISTLISILQAKDTEISELVEHRNMHQQEIQTLKQKLTQHRSNYQDKIHELESRISNFINELSNNKQELSSISQQQTKTKLSLKQATQQINILESQQAVTQGQKQAISQHKNILQQQNQILQQQNQGLQENVQQLKKQCELLRAEKDSAKTEAERRKKESDWLREELSSLQKEYTTVSLRLQELQEQDNESKINELIENYDKVEELARERNCQNEQLKEQMLELRESLIFRTNELNTLNKHLHQCEVELAGLRKFKTNQPTTKNVPSISLNSSMQREQPATFTNINLIRQNNRLIERVTELEKEKNMLYSDFLDYSRRDYRDKKESISPVRIIGPKVNDARFDIQAKIEELKLANESLLENLKI